MKNLVFLTVILMMSHAHARWATTDDATYVVNNSKFHYQVRKDANYILTIEREEEILKEAARGERGLIRLQYNPEVTVFKFLAAYTINGNRTVSVNKNDVEVRPLASSGQGLDSLNQVTIALPDVNIGSKLVYKYQFISKRPALANTFSDSLVFGWDEFLKKSEMIFASERPLQMDVFDPEKYLKKEETKGVVKITLTRPIFKKVVEEERVYLDDKFYPWIGVTTWRSWADFPKTTIAQYESILASPLPKKFEPILKAAEEKKTAVEQINTVTSMLNDVVRYVGDWRTVKGHYIPRPLIRITQSGFGDCKDFTVAAGAILKRLGYEVRAAWVWRGPGFVRLPLKLPTLPMNHAILYAVKDGQEFWIDPTNSVSYAQGILEDIADRPALVLYPSGPVVKQTRAMKASDSLWEVKARLDFSALDRVKMAGTVKFEGRSAKDYTGASLYYAKENSDHYIANAIINVANLLTMKVGSYSLTSRIVEPFVTDFEFEEKWYPFMTTAGEGYIVSGAPWLEYLRFPPNTRVSDLDVGYPVVWRRELTVTGRKAVFNKEVECGADSTWVDYKRQIRKVGSQLKISESMAYKATIITNAEIKTPQFADFQRGVINCMQAPVIIF